MPREAGDKRRNLRVNCSLPCRWRLEEEGSDFEDATVVNLGADGARLEVTTVLKNAAHILFEMAVPDRTGADLPDRKLSCAARVVWAVEGANNGVYAVGIEYTDLDPKFTEWLRTACQALRRAAP